MDRETALTTVQALFPRLRAGLWTTSEAGGGDLGDWRVEHRYHGRRRPTVEAYVMADGRVEDVDGRPLGGAA